jgi:hypothetical protein
VAPFASACSKYALAEGKSKDKRPPAKSQARLAPFVHATHCKDGILYRTAEGIVQQMRPVREGAVDSGASGGSRPVIPRTSLLLYGHIGTSDVTAEIRAVTP